MSSLGAVRICRFARLSMDGFYKTVYPIRQEALVNIHRGRVEVIAPKPPADRVVPRVSSHIENLEFSIEPGFLVQIGGDHLHPLHCEERQTQTYHEK